MIQLCIRIFFLLLFLSACKGTPNKSPHSSNISPGIAHNLILQHQGNHTFHIVDVRTASEYNSGHIQGAIHIDWLKNPTGLNDLNPKHTYLLYCQSGRRSQLAMNYLNQHGYPYLFNLKGGIHAWLDQFNGYSPSPDNE